MANDIKLGDSSPVTEDLKPIKVGGQDTAIEMAKHGNGAKVNGDLKVTGDFAVTGNFEGSGLIESPLIIKSGFNDEQVKISTTGSGGTSISIKGDSDGDSIEWATTTNGTTQISTSATNANITINSSGEVHISSGSSGAEQELLLIQAGGIMRLEVNKDDDGDAAVDVIQLLADGTTFGSIDMGTASTLKLQSSSNYHLNLISQGTGDVVIDSNGDIVLDSADGNFLAKKAGTEFSAANSSYAGMILGYTEMAYGTTSGRYDTTTSFVVINDNYDHGDGAEDHFLGVTFVVPPSNKVEIEVFLPYVISADGTLQLGLATATDATTLKAKFEVVAWDVDESDLVQIVQRWVIDGTDSGMAGGAWSAGESKTLYCTVKENSAGGRVFWGDGFINYGDMTMKATALPTTIGDGT